MSVRMARWSACSARCEHHSTSKRSATSHGKATVVLTRTGADDQTRTEKGCRCVASAAVGLVFALGLVIQAY